MTTYIEWLALRYVRARDEVTRLEKARRECRCEHEAPWGDDREPIAEGDHRTAAGPVKEYRQPCWKKQYIAAESEDGHTITHGGGWELASPPESWCESCKRRQAIHDQIKPARLRRSARLGALISATRSWFPAKKESTCR